MIVKLVRFQKTANTTFSKIFIDDVFVCYAVEDLERAHKEYGITAIPRGEYLLELITYGRHHKQYLETYGEWHKGMIHLKNVPNYEGILVHKGNFCKDTLGCVLPNTFISTKGNRGYGSGDAYEKLYPPIRDALLAKKEVKIIISSEAI